MGLLATIVTAVLAISFAVFVALFGRLPVFRRTPIAWLHRLFVVRLPNGLLALDQCLTGGRLGAWLHRFGSFMLHDKHPTILIFFLLLLSVSEALALPPAWPLLGGFQQALIVVLIVLPYVFLYLAAYSDPGTVSLATLPRQLLQYPYDYALFFPGARCRTCQLIKPPRSKHCSVCKRCVSRLDHHCIFINNCVGAGNQHWFLLLLFFTALLATYAGVVGTGLIAARTQRQFPTWTLWWWRARNVNNPAEAMSVQQWLVVLSWGMKDLVRLGSVSLLGLMLCPLVWGLLAYNLWNVGVGQTTNESLKWSDWQYDIQIGLVFRRRLRRGRGSEASQSLSRWPLEPEYVLMCTDDGRPPATDDPHIPGVGEWEQVWRLRDIDNIYDLGVWRNLMDVFVPDYQFKTQGLPCVEERGRKRWRTPK